MVVQVVHCTMMPHLKGYHSHFRHHKFAHILHFKQMTVKCLVLIK